MISRRRALGAMALRMNLLDEVMWDRCIIRDGQAAVYGWIERPDGKLDFVLLDFSWGTTEQFDGAVVEWMAVGNTTSSAEYSASIDTRLHGGSERNEHKDCEPVSHAFGDLVKRQVTFGNERIGETDA